MPAKRNLRVFLCHASQDKPVVRDLYQKLSAEPWIDPWLDEERLLPGQDWNLEIEKAVEASDAVIVCVKSLCGKRGIRSKRITPHFEYCIGEIGRCYICPAHKAR